MDIEANIFSPGGVAGRANDSAHTAAKHLVVSSVVNPMEDNPISVSKGSETSASVWSESATQPLAIDAPTAATLLGVSTAHFNTLLSGGRIPPGYRLGRRRLWSVSELQRWIDAGAPTADRWALIADNCIRAGHRPPPRGLPGILKKQR
ncbi:MAG: helix-turn-helix transcriptional regulator [Phycisphaerae bacterium]